MWLAEHNANYYSSKKGNATDVYTDAILSTIKKGKTLCVISSDGPEFDSEN